MMLRIGWGVIESKLLCAERALFSLAAMSGL